GGDLPAEQLCARTALDPGLDGIALCSRLRAHRGIEIAELGAGAPVADKRARSGIDLVEVEHRGPLCSGHDLSDHALSDHNPGLRSQPPQQTQHRRLRHRDTARGRCKIRPRQMQEHGAATLRDARARIVVDLDNEIVEMIVAREAIAALVTRQPDRPVVMAVGRVLAPGVFAANRAHRDERLRPRMTVGTPPELPRMKRAARRAAIAFALVGADTAASKRYRNGESASGEPALPGISGPWPNPDQGSRPIWCVVISH